MALSIGFRVLVSLHPAIQATGRLALAPTGLAPTRRTCLLWTRNHLIRPQQQRGWDGEAERFRGLEVDDQLELGGLLDGQISGLGALQDLVDEVRGAAALVCQACCVRHESARIHILSTPVQCRQTALRREPHNLGSLAPEHPIGQDDQSVSAAPAGLRERVLEALWLAYVEFLELYASRLGRGFGSVQRAGR